VSFPRRRESSIIENMDNILRTVEKLIPKKLYKIGQPVYHYLLTLLGAIKYGFPAKKIRVIGVTGTKGKSTTTEIINSIFEAAGYKTAVSGTIRFKIGDEERPNKFKMSMPGRFFMQKFLYDAVQAQCDFAIVEMTSEGTKQFRHKFIYLNAFIFTNLSPEHIESHGSFEKYKEAKLKIVHNLKHKDDVLIVNNDSTYSKEFVAKHKGKVLGFSLTDVTVQSTSPISFVYGSTVYNSNLIGEFNIQNILAAITVAKHFKISDEEIQKGLTKLSEVKGRAQFVPNTRGIDIVVDYAHTPDSLEAIYSAFKGKKKVCVLGNTGGGRDIWKRPKMAEIANTHCDFVFLTDEDPYDEDPLEIINQMKDSIDSSKLEIDMDRKSAMKKAILKANTGDAVLITGKGTDPYIMRAHGQKEPWSDFEKVKEILEELK
jgi:UDP-N-acetylmuramoyl-L-alanyl-D-glutamate--2,6-diaminopimelate ligase